MKIAGIIAEYNPFHRGHAWHIEQTRRMTGCDFVIACVDGHFTQRGEPAPFSRWERARMALHCGVDAVFELPTLFAARTADVFASGGVAILSGLGADVLSFGCENADRELIQKLTDLSQKEPTSVSSAIQTNLSLGMSHARAWGDAVAAHLGTAPEAVNRPNLILAAQYVRAIQTQGSVMEWAAIKRRGDYHDATMTEYASATAIRAAMARGEFDRALEYIPEAARPFARPETLHPMDDMLLMKLRDMTADDLTALPDVSEGLEQRICRLCREVPTREKLLEALKCKRYTRARLSRVLTYALLGLTKELTEAYASPEYVRLIGARRDAGPLLKEIKRRSVLPIIANPAGIREAPVFQFECRATDLWALLHDEPALRLPGRELREKFVTV